MASRAGLACVAGSSPGDEQRGPLPLGDSGRAESGRSLGLLLGRRPGLTCVSSSRAATREPATHVVADHKTDFPPRRSGGRTSDTVPLGLMVRCWQGWRCLETRDVKPFQPLEAAHTPWLPAHPFTLKATRAAKFVSGQSPLTLTLMSLSWPPEDAAVALGTWITQWIQVDQGAPSAPALCPR